MSLDEKVNMIVEMLDYLVHDTVTSHSLRQYLIGCIEELRDNEKET